jgi:hypothetical protein
MANTLILNQPQVFNGLGTLTYVVGTTGNYNVQVQVTVPEALPTGDGGGSGQGLGSGAGGGDPVGFADGGGGLGVGGVGQGFGAVPNNYNQPPAYGSNATSGAAISSGLSIVVNDNGSPIFTAPVLSTTQSAQQFKYSFQATSGHTITVVLSSSTASDEVLNGVVSQVTIGQGF